jgi:LysM repeat protein
MKRGVMVASILVLIAIVASACDLQYSTPPAVTDTPISLFATPMGQATDMNSVESFATGTALAIQSGTPGAGVITATPFVDTTQQSVLASVTPTSIIALPTNAVTTPTATLAVAGTVAPTSQAVGTSAPVGSRPASYTLQEGEFPFCIARRYDVDPDTLLNLSGLSDGVIYPPGTVLRIPQSGSFPGARALRPHATYTASAGETLYGVACKFGDITPDAIATANGLSVGATLTSGQQLTIP